MTHVQRLLMCFRPQKSSKVLSMNASNCPLQATVGRARMDRYGSGTYQMWPTWATCLLVQIRLIPTSRSGTCHALLAWLTCSFSANLAVISLNGTCQAWRTWIACCFMEAQWFESDLSEWDVSRVTDMSRMFMRATTLFHSDISKWQLSSLTSMDAMFLNAESFKQELCGSLCMFCINLWVLYTQQFFMITFMQIMCILYRNPFVIISVNLQKNIYEFLQVIIKQSNTARTDIYFSEYRIQWLEKTRQ